MSVIKHHAGDFTKHTLITSLHIALDRRNQININCSIDHATKQMVNLPYHCKVCAQSTLGKIMAKKKLENFSFEESLTELDTIVKNLEQGELGLEESMALFERGLNLSQLSQVKLSAAEQKVKILLEKNGTPQLIDFESDINGNENHNED